MTKRNLTTTLLLFLALGSFLNAQVARQSGVIRGTISDSEGNSLPGVAVSVTSPSLQGTVSDVTSAQGTFRLANLPPGTYAIVAELSGFKTVKQENIIVQVGTSYTLNLTTEPSQIETEIIVTATPPTIDVQSTKVGSVITTDMMQRLPLSRNWTNIWAMVPGAAGRIDPQYSGSIHGATSTTVTYEVDGVNANDPTHYGFMLAPQFDTMEEIDVSTGGLPAQFGNTGGSFVNVVTKSGSNRFSGQLQTFYTNKDLNKVLFSDEQLKAFGIGKPAFAIYDVDASAILGGPIIPDKLWFFGSMSLKSSEFPSVFIPTVIDGTSYEQYDDPQATYESFLKLTTQFSKSLRFFAMFNGMLYNRDVYVGGGARTAYDATFTLNKNTWISTTGNLTWLLGANSFVDFRAGYTNRWYPIKQRDEYAANNNFTDNYTGYAWNGINSWESYITRRTHQASARFTHFQDSFLGGDHEFGMGVEWQRGMDEYGYARDNPLNWYLYNGNIYYYRGLYGLNEPHPTFGDGYLAFTNCGKNEGDSYNSLFNDRISAYFQDAWTIKKRLTVNAGLRFDYLTGWTGDAMSTGVDGLAYQIGEDLEPQLEALYGEGNGFNPFGPFSVAPIKDVMNTTMLSPRLGLTYDLFGDGKTALKASVSRYGEAVPVRWMSLAAPAVMQRYWFNWFDLNENGVPDAPGVDDYIPTSGLGTFARPDPEYLKSRIDPDKSAPYYWEFTTSISHEIFRNTSAKIQYIYKRGYGGHADAYYDRDTERYWYTQEQAPEWWVPFTTTVPAYGNYPAEDVTIWLYTLDSPWNRTFTRSTNWEDYKSVYNAVEFVFDKRFADGWALGGSVVIAKHDVLGSGGESNGLTSPNIYVNGYGRSPWDVPFQFKLYGTVSLPYGLISSFFLRHSEGLPYMRTVTIAPPTAWSAANNVYPANMAVNVEPRGERRNVSYDNLDVRLEKEFNLRFGRLGLFADVYNLLGNSYAEVGQNPGGTWRPTDNNVSTGTFAVASNYGKVNAITGVRSFKFSVRFTF